MLVAAAAYPLLWPERNEVGEIAAAATYTSDYFVLQSGPLQHIWSLAVEAQFYLLWPLVRFLPKRRAQVVLALLWAAATLWGAFELVATQICFAYTRLDTHAGGLILGSLMTYVRARPAPYGWLGLAIIGLVCLSFRPWTMSGFVVGVPCAEIGAAMVILAVKDAAPATGRLPRLLSWGPLARLGVISYGVYLWHLPISFALQRYMERGWLLTLITLGVSVVIASFSYETIEKAFRKHQAKSRTIHCDEALKVTGRS